MNIAAAQPNYRPDYGKIRSIAEKYVTDVKVPPVPIREIVERNGVRVAFVTFGPHSAEVAGVTEFSERRILVNTEDPLNRQTFTIAHEFGHWVLHRDLFMQEPSRYRVLSRHILNVPSEDPLEQEASFFAAAILVPTHLIKPVKGIASPREMARLFAVPDEAIETRLKDV